MQPWQAHSCQPSLDIAWELQVLQRFVTGEVRIRRSKSPVEADADSIHMSSYLAILTDFWNLEGSEMMMLESHEK